MDQSSYYIGAGGKLCITIYEPSLGIKPILYEVIGLMNKPKMINDKMEWGIIFKHKHIA